MAQDDTPFEWYGDDDDPYTTYHSMLRWEYIGTVLSAVMILSLAVITVGVTAGVLSLDGIGQIWFGLYSIVVMMAAIWTWGKETFEAIQKARGKRPSYDSPRDNERRR